MTLVPLRTGFDIAWTGYRRDQVRHYVRQVEFELEILAADRDAAHSHADFLAAGLDAARTENRRLREQLDCVCRTPIDLDGATDRVVRLVEHTALLMRQAATVRGELDNQAAQQRQQTQTDFTTAMAHRRALALRRIAELEHAAAARMRLLDDHRARVVAGLRAALDLVTQAEKQLGTEER